MWAKRILKIGILLQILFLFACSSNPSPEPSYSPTQKSLPSPSAMPAITPTPTPTNPVALPTVTTTPVPRATIELWESMAHPGIGVEIYYPEDWSFSSMSENPDTASSWYSGHDGHFRFYTIKAESLDSAVERYINHENQLFGSDPAVEEFQIRGQDARMIIPSADQSIGTAGDSVVIIRLPKPVRACSPPCHYLVLWADVEHLWKIAKTIRFLDY